MSDRTCTIIEDGAQCTKPRDSHGMCDMHAKRNRITGSPYLRPELPLPDLPGERWIPVVGWESFYEVSNLGRVKSLPRQTARGVRGGRLLKLCPSKGYFIVVLCDGTRQTRRFVHRLVLEAFAGPCPDGCETLHGPGGPGDNRWPENLQWGTPVENAADRLRDGTDPRGERSGTHKLTAEQVLEIRRRYATGELSRALAAEFGVLRETITSCVRGQSWAWLTEPGEQRTPRVPPGRTPRGSAHGNAKLTEADVLLIRSAYVAGGVTYQELAARFEVSRGLIGHIVRGATWTHLL